MTMAITTREIRLAAQRDELSSADCAKLRRQLLDHRAALKSRREAITLELRKEPERIVDLNREDEQLEVDLGVLYDSENAILRQMDRAADREADGIARDALKKLPFALERLQLANVEHQAAHSGVEEVLATIGGARDRLRRLQQLTSANGITDEQLEGLMAAVHYPPRLWTDAQIAYARSRLRRELLG